MWIKIVVAFLVFFSTYYKFAFLPWRCLEYFFSLSHLMLVDQPGGCWTYHTYLLLFSFHIISWIAFLVWWFLKYVLQVIQSIRLLFLFHSYTVYITFLGVNLPRIDSSQYSSFNHSRIATTSSLIIASQLLRTNVMMNGFKVREHLIICFNFVVIEITNKFQQPSLQSWPQSSFQIQPSTNMFRSCSRPNKQKDLPHQTKLSAHILSMSRSLWNISDCKILKRYDKGFGYGWV